MFCTNCGNNLNGKSFCTQCGMPVRNNNVIKKNNNKKILIILFSIIFVLFTTLILTINKDKIFNKKGNNSRTIMIYMVGADLESESGFGTIDIGGIDGNKVDLEHNNVLLIAGGSKKWNNDNISISETSIFKLGKNGFEKVLKQDKKNMGTSSSLSSFLDYVYKNYKTDKYDLIFWNHGAGIFGSEFDELHDDDGLNLLEIKTALSSSPFTKDNKLELVIFRTCLNATLEVADVFKDHASYLVASEETTKSFMGDLASSSALTYINEITPDDSEVDIGMKAINNYKNTIVKGCKTLTHIDNDSCLGNTYSITDLSKIDELYGYVNDFFLDISKDMDNNYDYIARVRSNLFQYAETAQDDFDLVDLYSAVDKLSSLSPGRANKVLDTIKDTVVYNYTNLDGSNGLSFYFPFNKTAGQMLTYYKSITNGTDLGNFMLDFYQHKNNKVVSKSFTFTNTDINVGDKNNGSIKADLSLELTDEQLKDYAKADYILFVKVDDEYYTPIRRSSDVTLTDNKLEAHVRGKQLRLKDKNSDDSYWLLLGEKERTKDYVKYENAVNLWKWNFDNDKDMEAITATLEILVDKEHPNGIITQVIETYRASDKNSENSKSFNLPSTKVEDINYYDTITYALGKYKILDENGNYNADWGRSSELRGLEGAPDEFEFIQEDFSDGYEYYCVFRIFDTAGGVHYSKLVKMN